MTRFIATLALALATLVPFAAHAQSRTGWGATAESLRGHNGVSYHFRCPAHGSAGTVWGTGTYTDDSSVCTAAVHAGKITLTGGGLVLIRIARGRSSYAGSTHHGIASRSYGSWDGSFTVISAQRMTGSSPTPAVHPTTAPAPAPGTLSGTTNGGTTWDATAASYRGSNGQRYAYSCPANGTLGSVWGTDVYTDDSSVCTAAMHAGLITQSGGTVTIEIRQGQSSYTGSSRNGVDSRSYDAWEGSFVFVRNGAAPPTTTPPPAATVASGGSGWDATAVALRGRNNQRFSYICPANGELGSVWGTDTYSDDSSVCTAAVHAGIITQSGGGTVVIEIRPGQSSYAASSRNGVDSQNYDAWDGSFVFVR